MIFLFLLQCLWTKLCYLYHSILLHLMGVISLFFHVIRLKDFFSVFFFHVFWPFSYIKFTICFWRLPCVKQEAQQHKILYLGLYLLIWGEAANLRFMPECLCYIFHHVSWKFCWNWLRFYARTWIVYFACRSMKYCGFCHVSGLTLETWLS